MSAMYPLGKKKKLGQYKVLETEVITFRNEGCVQSAKPVESTLNALAHSFYGWHKTYRTFIIVEQTQISAPGSTGVFLLVVTV